MKKRFAILFLVPFLVGCQGGNLEEERMPTLKVDGPSGKDDENSSSSSSSSSSSVPPVEDSSGILDDIGGSSDIVLPDEPEKEEDDNFARYRIVFVNADGTILQDEMVKRDVLPTYSGKTPTLSPTDVYSFVFDHWTPEIVPASENATYTAVYRQIKRFDVTFADDDVVLDVVKTDEGDLPEYDVEKLVREPTRKYQYRFKGIEEELLPVDGDTTYQVSFTESLREYKVSFLVPDSEEETFAEEEEETEGFKVVSEQTLRYGSIPTIPDDAVSAPDGYAFKGFVDENQKGVHSVTGEATYKPKFVPLCTVKIEMPDGDSLSFEVPQGDTFVLPWLSQGCYAYRDVTDYSGFDEYAPDTSIVIDDDKTFEAFDAQDEIPEMTFQIADGKATLLEADYSRLAGDVISLTVPNAVYDIEGKERIPVTVFGDGFNPVFHLASRLDGASVYLPEGIETIRSGSLRNLPSMTMLTLPESLLSVEEESIQGAFSLHVSFLAEEAPELAENWLVGPWKESYGESGVLFRQDGVFYRLLSGRRASVVGYDPESLAYDVAIPEKLWISDAAFDIVAIEEGAFADSEISDVVLPESLLSIGEGAFKNCRFLQNITIPEKVTRIERSTFEGCSSLSEAILPETLKAVGDYAFQGTALSGTFVSTYFNRQVQSLNLFRLPAFLEEIGDHAFYGTRLHGVLISKFVSRFGREIFGSLDQESSVTLYLEREKEEMPVSPNWSDGTIGKEYGIRETLPPTQDGQE